MWKKLDSPMLKEKDKMLEPGTVHQTPPYFSKRSKKVVLILLFLRSETPSNYTVYCKFKLCNKTYITFSYMYKRKLWKILKAPVWDRGATKVKDNLLRCNSTRCRKRERLPFPQEAHAVLKQAEVTRRDTLARGWPCLLTQCSITCSGCVI